MPASSSSDSGSLESAAGPVAPESARKTRAAWETITSVAVAPVGEKGYYQASGFPCWPLDFGAGMNGWTSRCMALDDRRVPPGRAVRSVRGILGVGGVDAAPATVIALVSTMWLLGQPAIEDPTPRLAGGCRGPEAVARGDAQETAPRRSEGAARKMGRREAVGSVAGRLRTKKPEV